MGLGRHQGPQSGAQISANIIKEDLGVQRVSKWGWEDLQEVPRGAPEKRG